VQLTLHRLQQTNIELGVLVKRKLEPAYFATFHTFTVGPVKGDREDKQVEYGIGD